MAAFYLESSALFKKYQREQGTDVLQELFLSKLGNELFIASRLTILEIDIVAARLHKSRRLRTSQYRRLVDRVSHDVSDYGIVIVPLDNTLIDEAYQLLPAYPLRAADALHFATARRVAALVAGQPYYVVTADRELSDACRAFHLDVFNPELLDALDTLRRLR